MLATKPVDEVSEANEAEGDGVAEGEVLGVNQKFVRIKSELDGSILVSPKI